MRTSSRGVHAVGTQIGLACLAITFAVVLTTTWVSSGTPAGSPTTPEASVTTGTPVEAAIAPVPLAPLPMLEPIALARPIVVLYGDSLSWEARDFFVTAFAGHPEVQVFTRTFGGTAICDWLDDMRADTWTLDPGAVVVQFSGNSLTRCMQDRAGRALSGDAYRARYRADAEAVTEIFEPLGTALFFAGSPLRRPSPEHGVFEGDHLGAMYAAVAAEHPAVAHFVDAGVLILDHGRWTDRLPCLPVEPCEGGTDASGRKVNVVRSPDGTHFCPATVSTGPVRCGRAGPSDSPRRWPPPSCRRSVGEPLVQAV